MKTKDYVRLFKLDKPFYEFSREKFLNELGREFNQRVEDTRLERQRRNLEFTFSIFNKIVKEIEKLEEPKKSNGNKKPKNNKSLSHKTSN